MNEKMTYKAAGVDTLEGAKAVDLMKAHVKQTFNDNVLAGLGGFGGLFQLDLLNDFGAGRRRGDGIMHHPVLVAGTDGVGTKLKLAFLTDKHDTIGIDCVAMCVNDVLCQGAKPLFFLDYIATGKLKAEKIADIVKGVAEGCKQSHSALIGGETAEMPGFYGEGEYDMAGFSVGIADRKDIITGEHIKAGNKIIAIQSSGVHSNGYSLVRKLFLEDMNVDLNAYVEDLGESLGDALLRPTKIYYNAVSTALEYCRVNGIVHITGGGFYENIPRIIPAGLSVAIDKGSWEKAPIFDYIAKCGRIEEREMFSTFNMGVGMMLFVDDADAEGLLEALKAHGEKAYLIGEVTEALEERVVLR